MKIHCASCQLVHWTLPSAKGCQIDRIGYIWSEIIESLTRIFLDLVRWNLAVPCNSFLIPRNTNSFDLLVLLLNLFSICFRVGVQPWLAILQSLGMVESPCVPAHPASHSVSNKYQQNLFALTPSQKLTLGWKKTNNGVQQRPESAPSLRSPSSRSNPCCPRSLR